MSGFDPAWGDEPRAYLDPDPLTVLPADVGPASTREGGSHVRHAMLAAAIAALVVVWLVRANERPARRFALDAIGCTSD